MDKDTKTNKNLSTNVILGVGTASSLVALIIGGVIGGALGTLGSICIIIGFIYLIIETIKKQGTTRNKIIGFCLFAIWLILSIIGMKIGR